MGFDPLDADQDMLDLGREDVDAADDQHVVGTAGDLLHPHQGPAAGTGLVEQPGDILGPVADQRDGLLGQGGEDQFSQFAGRQDATGIGIDDLGQEVVLEDVQAAAGLEAFHRHPPGR